MLATRVWCNSTRRKAKLLHNKFGFADKSGLTDAPVSCNGGLVSHQHASIEELGICHCKFNHFCSCNVPRSANKSVTSQRPPRNENPTPSQQLRTHLCCPPGVPNESDLCAKHARCNTWSRHWGATNRQEYLRHPRPPVGNVLHISTACPS